jgi:protease II
MSFLCLAVCTFLLVAAMLTSLYSMMQDLEDLRMDELVFLRDKMRERIEAREREQSEILLYLNAEEETNEEFLARALEEKQALIAQLRKKQEEREAAELYRQQAQVRMQGPYYKRHNSTNYRNLHQDFQ